MKAKIIWFPQYIVSVTKDNLNFIKDSKHYEKIKNEILNYGLYFPGVIMHNEIHSGHHRLKIAKELGYDGIQMYNVKNFADVNFLSRFNELSYIFFKKTLSLQKKMKPQTIFI